MIVTGTGRKSRGSSYRRLQGTSGDIRIMFAPSIARAAASAAAGTAASTATSASSSLAALGGAASTSTMSAYLLLSRQPTILRSPTPFESAYHAYNSKIQRALAQPFPREIYFKKGSAAEVKFLEEEKQRRNASSTSTSPSSSSSSAASSPSEKKGMASPAPAEEAGNIYSTASRLTAADKEGKTDSLERSLDRSLFLLVKGGEMGKNWTLPFAKVSASGSDILHRAASTAVHSILGEDMDIWMVTNLPVGVVEKKKKTTTTTSPSSKDYIMRAHILAGQPDAKLSSSKGIEFAWLTREEVQSRMPKEQFDGVEDLLSS